MPAGNDAAEAGRELLAATGGVGGNAEELVAQVARTYPKALKSAQVKRLNESATGALDQSAVEKQVDGRVLDFAVRGENVVIVEEDSEGRTHKVLVSLDDFGRAGDEARAAGEDEPEDDDAADKLKSAPKAAPRSRGRASAKS